MTTPLSSLHRLLLALVLASLARAQEISPLLVGNNLWYAEVNQAADLPSATVMNHAGQVGLKLIRIGGAAFDVGPPSNADLLIWVDRIRAIGAEPIIQVSQYASVDAAASAVRHLNVTHGRDVRYWSIGNEPWKQANDRTSPDLTETEIAARIEGYFKPRAAAMKEADASIKIFGVNNEDFRNGLYTRLFGGTHNIAGLVPGRAYHYCDGITWHRYPQDEGIDPSWQGLADIKQRINQCVALVASANSALGRTGDDALLWAIGEFNSRDGPAVHTWGNGQMFAGVYGLAMRHGAHFAAAWSLRESVNTPRGPKDLGLLEGAESFRRPSYWHTQFVARHFTGRYAEGSPSVSSDSSPLLVYGAVDDALDRVSVLIMNRGDTSAAYTLHLNSANTSAAPGRVALRVNAGRTETHSDTLEPRSTHVLVFARHTLTRITYSAADFAASRTPTTTRLPRPLATAVDDFAAPGGLSETPYWTRPDINGGQSSLSDGRLVLRAGSVGFSTAAIAGQVTPEFNFFKRGFTLAVLGLAQSAADTSPEATSFRLALASGAARPFRADDALTLRITPSEARLGFKLDQPDVQAELRAGASVASGFLELIPLAGAVSEVHLSLEPDPAGPVAGVSTIHYVVRLDGAFGRVLRAGSFAAPRSAWGAVGDSSLVFEARRDTAASGSVAAFVEARVDAVTRQPALLDDFNAYASFADQAWWTRVIGGAQSSVTLAAGSASLLARNDAFAAAQLAGPVTPELNFFDRPLTLELRDLDLSSADLASGLAVFRLSLSSTAERSFVSSDALALRLTSTDLQLGVKLDQPSTNAEQRTGASATPGSLVSVPLPGPVTGVLLTLMPAPAAPPGAVPVTYVLRITGAFGARVFAGSFVADRALWGAAGDSALVLEARRNEGVARAGSYIQAVIGAVAFRSAPEDLFANSPRFATWRLGEFSASALAAPSVSGPHAAPAGDGVSNLLKYALGLPPRAPLAGGSLPAGVLEPGGAFALIHSERLGSELIYAVERSTDLVTWTTPLLEQTRTPDAAGWEDVVTRVPLSADSPRVFMRLRVTAP